MAALKYTKGIGRPSRADFIVCSLTIRPDRQFLYYDGLYLCFVGSVVGRRCTNVEAFNPTFVYHFDSEGIDH